MKKIKIILLALILVHGIEVLAQDAAECISRATAYADRSLFSEAIELYTVTIEKEDDYRLFTGRGEVFLQTGNIDKAIDDFKQANSLEPGTGYMGLARAYAMGGDYRLAADELQRHLRSDYRLPRNVIMLDTYLTVMEDSPEWRELWKKDWYNQMEQGMAEIEYYIAAGRTEEAERVFSDIEYTYRERPGVSYLRGLIAAEKNNIKEALENLRLAIDSDDTKYSYWELYIEQLAENGEYLTAAKICDRAMDAFPDKTGLIYKKSEYLRLAGDREKALQTAENYLDLYPDKERAIRQAGVIAGEKGEYSKALRYFSRNIENHPGEAECFTDRADVYMKIKSWDAAVYDYSMALDLWPRDGDALYNKGLALLNKGKTEEACHDFRMALRYGNRKASAMLSKHCSR
ncbi:MAG: tetratricopeptide repeat protein [Bacteroidales bacterium]